VCLPECCFGSQYFCREEDARLFDLAEAIPGAVHRAPGLRSQTGARSDPGLAFSSGAPPGFYHNTAAVIGTDGEILGLYRKMHIPDDPLYFEKFLFHSRRSGVPQLRHAVRTNLHAGVLGPMVSRRRPASPRWAAR